MKPELAALHPYPFEKLRQLKDGITPPTELTPILLSIGEPKHQAPAFVLDTLKDSLGEIGVYPSTKGNALLRTNIARWLTQRFQLEPNSLDAEHHVLPVNGTREALFAFAQVIVDSTQTNPSVLMPNPFYQIYEGAALLAGAKPIYLDCSAENGYLPDYGKVDPSTWQSCQLLYLCTPGNPCGSVYSTEQLIELIKLADQYDFVIASDECYSEIYLNEDSPPPGLLQACQKMDRNDFQRCVVFHSLSKRSNLPGLRSGFVAGDKNLLASFLKYRTYHGCAMSLPTQIASAAAWQDEQHVLENRRLYRQKFSAVKNILSDVISIEIPAGGFYLWLETPIDGIQFAQQLYAQQNVTVLPGQFLSRNQAGNEAHPNSDPHNPGQNRVRIALVASEAECIDAAQRIKLFLEQSELSSNSNTNTNTNTNRIER